MSHTNGRNGTRFWRIWVGASLTLAALSSCDRSTAPLPAALVDDAVSLEPTPANYQIWWHEVEACSGKLGNFNAIAWYYVPNVNWFTMGAAPTVLGFWQPSRHSITLAGLQINNAYLVRHEALHVILNTVDHPPEYFHQKCASAVVGPITIID
jgi:hypothetical protein